MAKLNQQTIDVLRAQLKIVKTALEKIAGSQEKIAKTASDALAEIEQLRANLLIRRVMGKKYDV